MISDGIALLDLVRRAIHGRKVLSALFDPDGKRVLGDERIIVNVHPMENEPLAWCYTVRPVDDYVFLRVPVHPEGVQEAHASITGQPNADATVFRYIAQPDGQVRLSGIPPNVRVDFMVVGYRPADLLGQIEGSPQ